VDIVEISALVRRSDVAGLTAKVRGLGKTKAEPLVRHLQGVLKSLPSPGHENLAKAAKALESAGFKVTPAELEGITAFRTDIGVQDIIAGYLDRRRETN
jgi:Holliday junction resolvasome RuvABC DNA-binding subunit